MLDSNWSHILSEEAETELGLGLAPTRTPALPPLFFQSPPSSPNLRTTFSIITWVFQRREFHGRSPTRSVGTQTELQLFPIPTQLVQQLSTIECCSNPHDSKYENANKNETSTSSSRLSDHQASTPIGRQRSQSLTPDLEACRAIGAELRSLADTLNGNDGPSPRGRTTRSRSVFGSIFS